VELFELVGNLLLIGGFLCSPGHLSNSTLLKLSIEQGISMKTSIAGNAGVLAVCLIATQTLASDLVDTAASSGEAKSFVAALKTVELSQSLKKDGPYTVFAPSDAAFNKLPPDTKNELMRDKTKLEKVLAYHVIPGKVMVADVKPGKVQTLQGELITIKSDNGKVTVDDANVTQSDVTADNGVIHLIDTVVLPKN
jgi:uncharacterized surface protein with fasciclin (FAS1) repeats